MNLISHILQIPPAPTATHPLFVLSLSLPLSVDGVHSVPQVVVFSLGSMLQPGRPSLEDQGELKD